MWKTAWPWWIRKSAPTAALAVRLAPPPDRGGPLFQKKVFVNCSNKDKGPAVTKVCANSCIACGMCERTCKFDAIHVVNNVAVIDYSKCKNCTMCAKACPATPLSPSPLPRRRRSSRLRRRLPPRRRPLPPKAYLPRPLRLRKLPKLSKILNKKATVPGRSFSTKNSLADQGTLP